MTLDHAIKVRILASQPVPLSPLSRDFIVQPFGRLIIRNEGRGLYSGLSYNSLVTTANLFSSTRTPLNWPQFMAR
jgi:hypothetical protein